MTYANLGALEAAKGNRTAAESAFKRAVEVEPNSPSAHLALANFYWAANQLADAERELKRAFELDPKSANATRALAQLYMMANRTSDAEKFLKAYAALVADPGPTVVLADFYLALGRVKDAEAVLEPLLKTKEGYIAAKLRYARIENAAGRRPQAYRALDEALQRDKKSESARLERVRLLLADGKVAQAAAEVQQVVADNPQSVTGQYLRGSALSDLGEREEAIKSFQDVLRLSPSTTPALLKIASLYMELGDPKAAVDVLGQAIKLQPKSVLAHFLLAKAMLLLGNVSAAERDVMILAKIGANWSDAQALLGDFYWVKKDWGHSREAYTQALKLDRNSLDAVKGLIRLDLVQKNPQAARARIDSRLAASPDDTTLLLLAGKVYAQTGDPQRAEAHFRRILQADASNMSAYNELGALYLAQNRLEDARKEYAEAARKEPKSAVAATTMMGVLLTLQSKHAEARKQYEKALSLDPQAAVAANNLAWDYAENGGANLDIALQLAQTAKARLPNSWEANDTLGWIYYKKGLATLAVSAFRQGVEQNPSNPTVQYHLGLAHLKAGNRVEAQKALQRALGLDPKFAAAEDAKRVLGTIKG
jgi:tetratricopeptide (TPR) repeat protein